jgi:hypothetical protein
LIVTLLLTILVEGVVVTAYSLGRRKPLRAILLTSLCGNLVTQILLQVALRLFFPHYLFTLLVAEILVWSIESLLLYFLPANQLRFGEALRLSLGMNLASFALGWFLPV